MYLLFPCLTVLVGAILAMDFTPAAAAVVLVAPFDSGLHFSNTPEPAPLPLLGTPAPAVSAPSSEVWVSPHRSCLQAPETTVQLGSDLSQRSEFGRTPPRALNLNNPKLFHPIPSSRIVAASYACYCLSISLLKSLFISSIQWHEIGK